VSEANRAVRRRRLAKFLLLPNPDAATPPIGGI